MCNLAHHKWRVRPKDAQIKSSADAKRKVPSNGNTRHCFAMHNTSGD